MRLFLATRYPNMPVFNYSVLCALCKTSRICLKSHPITCLFSGNTVRLVDGISPWEGRVEVLHKGQWGTICRHGWDLADGHVVCNQLGFGNAQATYLDSFFGRGVGSIWILFLGCQGTEHRFENCPHSGWGKGNGSCAADHHQDASVKCSE